MFQYVMSYEPVILTDEEKCQSALIKTGDGDIMLLAPSVVAKMRGAVLQALLNGRLEVVKSEPDIRTDLGDYWRIETTHDRR